MSEFLGYLVAGAALGCTIALLASGFVVVHRVTGVVNFAQGMFPVVAGLAISFSDPSGPLDTVKESAAALRTLAEAAAPDGEYGPFVHALAEHVVEKRQNPLGEFRPSRRDGLQECLDELRRVASLVRDRTTEEEQAAFIRWIRTASQRVALAAREGGLLGFGGALVSEKEQEMLETIGELFGVRRTAEAPAAPEAPPAS